jgi:hypothetical protein
MKTGVIKLHSVGRYQTNSLFLINKYLSWTSILSGVQDLSWTSSAIDRLEGAILNSIEFEFEIELIMRHNFHRFIR